METPHKFDSKLEWIADKWGLLRKNYVNLGENNLRIYKLRLEANKQYPFHEHLEDEYVYLLSGSMSDENGEYNAGDLLFNEKETKHSVRCGPNDCEILVIKPNQI